jgi:hypothetical protein
MVIYAEKCHEIRELIRDWKDKISIMEGKGIIAILHLKVQTLPYLAIPVMMPASIKRKQCSKPSRNRKNEESARYLKIVEADTDQCFIEAADLFMVDAMETMKGGLAELCNIVESTAYKQEGKPYLLRHRGKL